MKKYFTLALFFFCFSTFLFSQTRTWYWSILKCDVTNSADSAFLVNTEKRMWKGSLTGAFPVYDGMFGGMGFRVKMTKAAADERFADTTIDKLVFPGGWELATLWNHAADTFELISFEPNCALLSRGNNVEKPIFSFETFLWAHVPLYYYQQNLEQIVFDRMRALTLTGLAKSFNATLRGDTLYRVVNFLSDSNQYLPQASYFHLASMIQHGVLGGQVLSYRNVNFEHAMSKRNIENTFVYWDSTNCVEDPNNPGTIVIAPIKAELRPCGIVIYEKWVPNSNSETKGRSFGPRSLITYHREIIAFGSRYSRDDFAVDRILWHQPEQVRKWLSSETFDWAPYEESFRAERFERMHIALEP